MKQEKARAATGSKVLCERGQDGAVWRVTLDAPKGNVIDEVMTAELTELFLEAAKQPHLKTVLLAGRGPHFSFGASVEEHRAERVEGMLHGFHRLFRTVIASGVPVVAAVRGHCLGGGLELVSFCQRVVAHPDASFGQPEITLGVFAPVASVVLADRVGRGAADDLLLTGRIVAGGEAREMGLVDQLAATPEAAALDWVEEHLLPHSASSLRIATRAARIGLVRRFEREIEELERLYLGELMATHDANEGIAAFLDKRKPTWSDA